MTAADVKFRYPPYDRVYRGRRAGLAHGRVSDVALIIAVLCMSINPAALRLVGIETSYALAATLLACALLRRGGDRAFRAFVPVGVVFATLCIVHAYTFDFFPIITVMGFFTRLFIGMAAVILVSDFVRACVIAVTGLSLLSFVFWVPEYITSRLGTPFHLYFAPLARLGPQSEDTWNLGFHTYSLSPQHMHRNAGMFWEPGAFAGYIIIALLMLAALRPSLTRKEHLAGLSILTLALFSTFSTAGYIAYPIALLLNYDWRKLEDRRQRARVALGVLMMAPLVLLGSLYGFTKLDFLQAKIQEQIMDVEHRQPGWQQNRIGTFVFDWEYISSRPLTGWGINFKTRFALTPWAPGHSLKMGNGMSSFIVFFGVIGFGTFLLGLGRGAYFIGGKSLGYVLGFLAATLVLLQGECFLDYPFFLGLMFLGHASGGGQRMPNLQLSGSGSPLRVPRRFSQQLTEL